MSGSCPVGATVCRDAHAEVERLRRWKADALPVLDGLQELGKALGLPLGSRITGTEALAAVERLTSERGDLTTEVERLRAALIAVIDDWEDTGRSDLHPLIRGAVISAAGQV